MNILVTGGAGYIGSHTVLKLKEKGHCVIVYDNLSKGYRELLHGDEFVEANVNLRDMVRQVCHDFGVDAVLHFAASIEAGESMRDPVKYFNNNTVNTLLFLDAMMRAGVRNFIFSSTAAVYGLPERTPISEDFPLQPVNAYGESKLLVERTLKWYSDIAGLKYAALRYFNAAGADEKLRSGERHDPETHLIPLALKTAYGERESLSVFGTDYPTKDGTCVRDYVHVSDLAEAHVLALDYIMKEKKSEIFNLGSERGFTVKEVIKVVKDATKRDFKVVETGRRPGDPAVLVASSEKIRRTLGWKPSSSDLEAIVRTADAYYRNWKGIK
jgi:UDP-glucose 4-epimerase